MPRRDTVTWVLLGALVATICLAQAAHVQHGRSQLRQRLTPQTGRLQIENHAICLGEAIRARFDITDSEFDSVALYDRSYFEDEKGAEDALERVPRTAAIDQLSLNGTKVGRVYFETLKLARRSKYTLVLCRSGASADRHELSEEVSEETAQDTMQCGHRVPLTVQREGSRVCLDMHPPSVMYWPVRSVSAVTLDGKPTAIIAESVRVLSADFSLQVDSRTRITEKGRAITRIAVPSGAEGVDFLLYFKSLEPKLNTEGLCPVNVHIVGDRQIADIKIARNRGASSFLVGASLLLNSSDIQIDLQESSSCNLGAFKALANATTANDKETSGVTAAIFHNVQSVIAQYFRSLASYIGRNSCFQRQFIAPVQARYNWVQFTAGLSWRYDSREAHIVIKTPVFPRLFGTNNVQDLFANISLAPDAFDSNTSYAPRVSLNVLAGTAAVETFLDSYADAELFERTQRIYDRFTALLSPLSESFSDSDFMGTALVATPQNPSWEFKPLEAGGSGLALDKMGKAADHDPAAFAAAKQSSLPVLSLAQAKIGCFDFRTRIAQRGVPLTYDGYAKEHDVDPQLLKLARTILKAEAGLKDDANGAEDTQLAERIARDAAAALKRKDAAHVKAPHHHSTVASLLESLATAAPALADLRVELPMMAGDKLELYKDATLSLHRVVLTRASVGASARPATTVDNKLGADIVLSTTGGARDALSFELEIGNPASHGSGHMRVPFSVASGVEVAKLTLLSKLGHIYAHTETLQLAEHLVLDEKWSSSLEARSLVQSLVTSTRSAHAVVNDLTAFFNKQVKHAFILNFKTLLGRLLGFYGRHPCLQSLMSATELLPSRPAIDGDVSFVPHGASKQLRSGFNLRNFAVDVLDAHVPYALRAGGLSIEVKYLTSTALGIVVRAGERTVSERAWNHLLTNLAEMVQGVVLSETSTPISATLHVLQELWGNFTVEAESFWLNVDKSVPYADSPVQHSFPFLQRACEARHWTADFRYLSQVGGPLLKTDAAYERTVGRALQYAEKRVKFETVRLKEMARVEELQAAQSLKSLTLDQLEAQEVAVAKAEAALESMPVGSPTYQETAKLLAARHANIKIADAINPFDIAVTAAKKAELKQLLLREKERYKQLAIAANTLKVADDPKLSALLEEERHLSNELAELAEELFDREENNYQPSVTGEFSLLGLLKPVKALQVIHREHSEESSESAEQAEEAQDDKRWAEMSEQIAALEHAQTEYTESSKSAQEHATGGELTAEEEAKEDDLWADMNSRVQTLEQSEAHYENSGRK